MAGRGRLTAIDKMPAEADFIIAQAAQALAARDETQKDIYEQFVRDCEELMKESRGELEFDIPASSSFHRYSMKQAKLTRRLDETRNLTKAIADKFDVKGSDDLSMILGETIKSLVFTIVANADEDKVVAKDVMQLASAFRQVQQALNLSADGRRKSDDEFADKVGEAVDTAAKAVGMTEEVAERVKFEILGVKATEVEE